MRFSRFSAYGSISTPVLRAVRDCSRLDGRDLDSAVLVMTLADLSNEALVAGLRGMASSERRLVARLVSYLVELEDRRIHLEAACSSLFDFCTSKLGFSESEAFRRVNAARLVRRFPVILGMISRGEIHLSALVVLRHHLTEENQTALLAEAAGKSKRGLQRLMAVRFPKPDVPSSIRKLPESPRSISTSTTHVGAPPSEGAVEGGSTPNPSRDLSDATRRAVARIEPLSSARHKVQFTASTELREKLERATRLMSHRNPERDLAVVVEGAIDLLLAKLERERLGKTSREGRVKSARVSKPGYISAAVRRAVFARDGEQCTYVSASGERCTERSDLEIEHVHPVALGGTSDIDNLCVLCRAHNRLMAERVFGSEYIQERIHLRRSKSPSAEPSRGTSEPAPTPVRGPLRRESSTTKPVNRGRTRKRTAEKRKRPPPI